MASNPGNDKPGGNVGGPGVPDPDQKTLHVWSQPVDPSQTNARPTISEAVSTIKPDDFTKVAETPCARNAFLTGIGTGFGAGGLRFVLGGNIGRASNLAAGLFVVGSMASYEYCQYLRRCERRDMKRNIEIVHGSRKEKAKKLAEEKTKQEEESKSARKPWYKFW